MDTETINFIFTAVVGLSLIPILVVGPVFIYKRFFSEKRISK